MATTRKVVQGDGFVHTRTNDILACKSNSTNEKAYGYLNYYVPHGAYIEVEFHARAISGNQGEVSIDYHGDINVIDGTVDDAVEITSTIWKPYKLAMAGRVGQPYVSVIFGYRKRSVGIVEFRDIVVKIHGVTAEDKRMGVIKIQDKKIELMDQLQQFANPGLSSVAFENGNIRVNYAPFESWYKPIITTSVGADRLGWTIHPSGVDRDTCVLTIANKDHTKEDASALVGLTYIHFKAEV